MNSKKSCSVFSKRLKELRKSKNLKQDEFGKIIGVSRGAISFYENGDRTPGIDFLFSVSKKFNISSDWLLGLPDNLEDSPSLSELIGLSEESIEALQSMENKTLSALNLFLSSLY